MHNHLMLNLKHFDCKRFDLGSTNSLVSDLHVTNLVVSDLHVTDSLVSDSHVSNSSWLKFK